ncbi:hypothetical protein QQS21_009634 [Conoideocrella luteorostrata]|uniref:Uncharacterized protein n=1 Tax=Conoideocrella luteorostrata TaxID=1105319 RepID=A0AAJ0CHI0_9HYPO|nr:hypothetical protein QQS21_009634 [Conoideocrella luteorostrata]
MKFTALTTLLALAVPFTTARPAVQSSSPVADSPSSAVQDTDNANPLDLAFLADRGIQLLTDFLHENHPQDDKPAAPKKRSIAVREVAVTLRDQLHSGHVDLNNALARGLEKFNSTTTEYDLNDLAAQGFQILRDGVQAQDFNKLAQGLFSRGTARLTRREAWSWAGLLNGPILRTAAKVGVSLASSALGKVDLNSVARSALGGLEKSVGKMDMNQLAGQGAGMLSSLLGGINLNGVAKSVLGFLFP